MTKFKTAEEFNALSEEDKFEVARRIAEEGYSVRAADFIDVEAYFELKRQVSEQEARIQAVAYAIGDFLIDVEDELDDLSDARIEFMSEVAGWAGMLYCGEYYSHGDGFWIQSSC